MRIHWKPALLFVTLCASPLALSILPETERPVPTVVPNVAHAQSANEGIQSLKSQSEAFVAIAKTVLPSVVSITTNRVISPASDQDGMFGDRFMQRFFDDMPEEFRQQGSGSGVIVSADGYILTNNHVIQEADELEVVLHDGRHFLAELVGRDPQSDVAVIRIDAQGLQPAEFGNSDDLEVGEWVLAAGNPFQLSSSITSGIVSAIGRSNIGLTHYENFIQTDAAINPGNSGGALVDLDGNVVGINTAIATRSGGYQGIGFAIPSNMARELMDQLIQNGKVTRGFLGVNIGDLDDTMAEYYGLDEPHGAIVNRVNEDSPADRAGLEQGDVVIAVNGMPIQRVSDLQIKIASLKPGTDIKLEIVRDGARKTLTAQLDELKDEEEPGFTPKPKDEADDFFSRLGFEATELTQPLRREYELPGDADGVLVTKVKALGPAGKANLREGDVILQVDHQPVSDVRDLRSVLEKVGAGDPALFLVQRGDVELHLALRIPD